MAALKSSGLYLFTFCSYSGHHWIVCGPSSQPDFFRHIRKLRSRRSQLFRRLLSCSACNARLRFHNILCFVVLPPPRDKVSWILGLLKLSVQGCHWIWDPFTSVYKCWDYMHNGFYVEVGIEARTFCILGKYSSERVLSQTAPLLTLSGCITVYPSIYWGTFLVKAIVNFCVQNFIRYIYYRFVW